MIRRALIGALVLLLSGLLTAPAAADDAMLEPLPRDHPHILDTASITVTIQTPLWRITVDQRFFNRPGNEQRGLRITTDLDVPDGGQYSVPDAGPGYATVACADVDIVVSDEVIEQGPGTWTATGPGVHLVCYRQTPGSPGGPSPGGGTEEPEVLDRSIDAEDTQVLASDSETRLGSRTSNVLAVTGSGILVLLLTGTLFLLAGYRLTRERRGT